MLAAKEKTIIASFRYKQKSMNSTAACITGTATVAVKQECFRSFFVFFESGGITKHFMADPSGNSEFYFPETLNVPPGKASKNIEDLGETKLTLSVGGQNSYKMTPKPSSCYSVYFSFKRFFHIYKRSRIFCLKCHSYYPT